MNKELENWFRNNEDVTKQHIQDIADRQEVTLKFKGFYIEDNNLVLNGAVQPFYKDYNDYVEKNPYAEITHVRYFFEVRKADTTKVLTVLLEKDSEIHLGFSIEELGGGISFNESSRLLTSDFSLLETYVKKKFQ